MNFSSNIGKIIVSYCLPSIVYHYFMLPYSQVMKQTNKLTLLKAYLHFQKDRYEL